VVPLSRTTVIVKVAHVRLFHSRMLFARAYRARPGAFTANISGMSGNR